MKLLSNFRTENVREASTICLKTKHQKDPKKLNLVVIFLGALMLCSTAILNGYPLVYSDTGTYISSGYTNIVPYDRSIFYGLFLRHISLSESLWLVVLVQGFILSYLIYLTLSIFFRRKLDVIFLTVLTTLTLTTGISFNVSILIADVFSAITLLSLINLLINQNLSKFHLVSVSALLFYSIGTHLSNIPILFLLLALILFSIVIKRVRNKAILLPITRVNLVVAIYLGSLLFIPGVNYCLDGGFKWSKGGHVFMVNHLIEIGVMDEFLEENCTGNEIGLCQYKDELRWDFLWNSDSPLYKTGGWVENTEEYNEVIRNILLDKKYWGTLCYSGISYTIDQFFTFHTTLDAPVVHGYAPDGQINWRYPNEVKSYKNSKQRSLGWDLTLFNQIEKGVIYLSYIILMLALLLCHVPEVLRWVIKLAFGYALISSAVCANLSMVHPRFQNRLVWVFPLLTIIVLIYHKRRELSFK